MIGFPVRWASAKPPFHVPCQAIFSALATIFEASACAWEKRGGAKKAPASNMLRLIICLVGRYLKILVTINCISSFEIFSVKPFLPVDVITVDSQGRARQRELTAIQYVMKRYTLIPIFLGGLMTFSLCLEAQERPGQGGGRGPGQGGRGGEGGRGGGQNIREAMIKKFDKNGDGKLDENERPSREQIQAFFREQLGGGQDGRPGGPGARGGRGGEGGRLGGPGQGGPGDRGGFGGRGGFRPPNPVMEAIDTNKDGALSADELKNASKALAALDKNKDGKIDQEEMRPQFDRAQGGRGGSDRGQGDRPGGFRRPGQGGQGDRPGGFRRPGQGGQGDRPGGFRRPGQEGGRGESRPGGPGAGGRENPQRPRGDGDRNAPPRKDI